MNEDSAVKKSTPRAIKSVDGGEASRPKLMAIIFNAIDYVLYVIARCLYLVLSALPLKVLYALFHNLIRLFVLCNPRFTFYARKNLNLVFPGEFQKQERLLKESIESFTWLVVDVLRAPKLNKQWLQEHVKITGEGAQGFCRAVQKGDGKGGILVTGHLSSYELIAWIAPQVGMPMMALMRPFKNKYLNQWIMTLRGRGGARVCSHKNSFFEMLRAIKKGETVGFVFDQNITRNFAIFVDWFGVPAATTKGLGFAAVSTKCPIMVSTVRRVGVDSYELDYEEIVTADVYAREDLGDPDKAVEITRRVVKSFEKCVLRDPGSWFWFHRRWKTRPEGEPEDFYKNPSATLKATVK